MDTISERVERVIKRFTERKQGTQVSPGKNCPCYGRSFKGGENYCFILQGKCTPSKQCERILNDKTERTPVWGRLRWYR